MEVTVFDTVTGEIAGRYARPDVFDVLSLLGPDQDFLPGWYDLQMQRVDVATKAVLDLPPSPGPWAIFDYAALTWTDPRDPSAELEAVRAAASMTRSEFVMVVVRTGIVPMTLEEAGQAARGEIPLPFQQIIQSLPAEDQLEAVVRWSGSTVIERTNPILLLLAQHMGISEAQLDQLYQIALN